MAIPRKRLPKIQRRVPEDMARQVFRRLQHDGALPIILDVLRDHRDTLGLRIQMALGAELLADAHVLARFQARQGAYDEVGRIITTFEVLGSELAKVPTEPRAAG